MKKSFAQILEGIDSRSSAKMAAKLPSWHSAGCTVPSSLALEQCSSEAAALYKAGLTGPGGGCIADLTGGMGVDCRAFAQRFSKVLYFERNQTLADEAIRNFSRLGTDNIEVCCAETGKEFLESGRLGQTDWIYLDPARRDAAGKKVFLLEDCSPNVLELLPLLWEHSPHILLKLSPMADISMIRSRLGDCLKEIHIAGLGGEVKELLCILEKDYTGPFRCFMAQLDGDSPLVSEAVDSPDASLADPVPGMTLLEPGALLLKAGIRNIEGLSKPAPFTNLFLCGDPHTHTSGEESSPSTENRAESAKYREYCKAFIIKEILPLNRAGMKEAGTKYPKAEVSAKNIPMSSDELRKRLGCKSGGSTHIFGISTRTDRLLLICERQHN